MGWVGESAKWDGLAKWAEGGCPRGTASMSEAARIVSLHYTANIDINIDIEIPLC